MHHLGEFAPARVHLGQGVALYDPQQHRTHAFEYGRDPGIDCHAYLAWTLWPLGYPDQAAVAMQQTLTLAEGGSHPFSLATALFFAAWLYQYRREIQVVQAHAEAAIAIAAEQRFPQWLAGGIVLRGWVLVAQGQAMEGI